MEGAWNLYHNTSDVFYKCANIIIKTNLVFAIEGWEKFRVQVQSFYDFKFEISLKKLESYHISCFKFNEEKKACYLYNNSILLCDEKWKYISLIQWNNFQDINIFLTQVFYTHAVWRSMIQFHSSLIDYKGKGILFLGPSGIGKTTQAELWNKYRDALIINGDIVFIQETKENFLGWGTPWHGSSPYCENTSVPVHAMIVLKQAPENSIRELTGFEKVTAVSNNVFYPQWLENGMELCLETLDHLLSAIPVYELSCRPDEEAVRLMEETLFGN